VIGAKALTVSDDYLLTVEYVTTLANGSTATIYSDTYTLSVTPVYLNLYTSDLLSQYTYSSTVYKANYVLQNDSDSSKTVAESTFS
jgi:hypothetical protein